MKANKALKRLAKIDDLMAEVAKRFSGRAPDLGEVLKDLKAAVARAKEAVTGHPAPARSKKKKIAGSGRPGPTVAKAAIKPPKAQAAKKRAPIKKAARRTAVKMAAVSSRSPARNSVKEIRAESAE